MRDIIVSRLHFSLRNPARFVLGLGVLAFITAPAPVPDIDHPIAWFLGLDNGRFLHPYFDLVGTWFIICGLILAGTLLGGYAFTGVLNRKGKAGLRERITRESWK
ncbi:hypothetical protein ES707_10591 [subsurface metagenome]